MLLWRTYSGARAREMLRRPAYDKCVDDAATNERLSTRQKLALVVGTSLKAETLCEMADEAIDYDFLKAHDVSATVLKAAKFSVAQLKQRIELLEHAVLSPVVDVQKRGSGSERQRRLLLNTVAGRDEQWSEMATSSSTTPKTPRGQSL